MELFGESKMRYLVHFNQQQFLVPNYSRAKRNRQKDSERLSLCQSHQFELRKNIFDSECSDSHYWLGPFENLFLQKHQSQKSEKKQILYSKRRKAKS